MGATSQIAKDLIRSFAAQTQHNLILFARRPDAVVTWLRDMQLHGVYTVAGFEDFHHDLHFDVVLNFVGVGNPAQAIAMGASIFDVTLKYDEMAVRYQTAHPECRYIFLSSGAAYGSRFDEPADENTYAEIPINHLLTRDWYSVAKMYAECRHRALPHLPIIDVRVFNYVSRTQDISERFLITDILRAIKSGKTLKTNQVNIVRDYIGPSDFFRLIQSIISSPLTNDVIDCYTKSPIDKFSLLNAMKSKYELKYSFCESFEIIDSTGMKMNYYSNNRRAEKFGYEPSGNSLDIVLEESFSVINSKAII
ncbi:NAD-dependent epimerase/dehydratase family protein [Sphingorhabdus sp.]|uniref:NAD-dependent epimerase/dehydratase family protein n=1 Tax=Sphingorhabdus sp. TaxID=1902408 RepID=UPI0025FDD87D|nr:NAD-dependent epimerase/dehydratase family protein [Sphingorhabdus sp.]